MLSEAVSNAYICMCTAETERRLYVTNETVKRNEKLKTEKVYFAKGKKICPLSRRKERWGGGYRLCIVVW